mgnify:CR=1 FL=1
MKVFWKIIALAGIMFLGGFSGMVLGALIGGNYLENFVFINLRGYEASGQLGAIIGALLSIVIAWNILFRKTR